MAVVKSGFYYIQIQNSSTIFVSPHLKDQMSFGDAIFFSSQEFYIEEASDNRGYIIWAVKSYGRVCMNISNPEGGLFIDDGSDQNISDAVLWTIDPIESEKYLIRSKADPTRVWGGNDGTAHVGDNVQSVLAGGGQEIYFNLVPRRDYSFLLFVNFFSVVSTLRESDSLVVYEFDCGELQLFHLDFINVFEDNICQIWNTNYSGVVSWDGSGEKKATIAKNQCLLGQYWVLNASPLGSYTLLNYQNRGFALSVPDRRYHNGEVLFISPLNNKDRQDYFLNLK